MAAVNIKEARRRLSELVSRAAQGESVLITRRGRGVARLDPVRPEARRRLPDLSDFRRSLPVRAVNLSRAVVAQRRQERY